MFGSSQAFGYEASATPMQAAPKPARQEEKQTVLPVTVRLLQDAAARHAESQEVLIHGIEVAHVHLVGVVEALVEQSTMIEFQLNDSSGRIKVRCYSSGEGSVKGLAAGRYVSVVGNLRTSPTAHVSAMNLRMITGADEVSYHMIEVAHASLRLRTPTKAMSMSTAVAAVDPITPAKQSFGGAFGGASNSPILSPAKQEAPPAAAPMAASLQTPPKTDLRSAVIDALRQVQESGNEEGLSSSDLSLRLAPGQASAEKIRDMLAQLVEEGDVFHTIDENHFAVV